MRSDRERLLDILEAIDKVDAQRGVEREEFDTDELFQVWFVHYLQIIGEAASRLSDDFRAQHAEVPWGQLIGMRHILVHGYFDVDLDIVWNAVKNDIVKLKAQILAIVHRMGNAT